MTIDNLATSNTTSVDDVLAEIWKDIFKTDTIDPNDDFFALGGNSLTAVKFISKIEEQFGPESLLPEVLYEDARFQSLAAAITNHINS